MPRSRTRRRLLTPLVALAAAVSLPGVAGAQATPPPSNELVGRAVLPAESFAPGPTSGRQITGNTNGVPVPFVARQPIQGFSAVVDNKDGTFLAMPDNGYGALGNSADFNLRVYRIRPRFETAAGGDGGVAVESFIELRDPDRRIPFAITNHFSTQRILTGADFDIESLQRTPDGTLWFGDEFGPYLLHTDADGKVLDAPFALPDAGGEIRSPQNPSYEEASAIRIMNAVREQARRNGNDMAPVFSPDNALLDDDNAATNVPSRLAPPAGSGLSSADSEIFNVAAIQAAGYPVVPYTVNDPARMDELLRLRVNGLISDRPDLLLQRVAAFDADGNGTPGDYLLPDGRINRARFDAQGHRGARNLRPENTLPAMEAALDNLMPTLELDTGLSADGQPILSHDPVVESDKCRRADGAPYGQADEVLIKDRTVTQLQSTFICDKLFRGPSQVNDRSLSPVSTSFASGAGLPDAYVQPTLQQVFSFVNAYVAYYDTGAGSGRSDAAVREANAREVRFNIETKLNPRPEFVNRTAGPDSFASAVAFVIIGNGLTARADIQSFDFRSLLRVQDNFPAIRTVYLFGDFPIFANRSVAGSDEGTNLQPDSSGNTPWLAGLRWPYRSTYAGLAPRARQSGGFEGMALTTDGRRLLPLLELPLTDEAATRTLRISEFDLATKAYTGTLFRYPLDPRGTNIGDFVMFSDTGGVVIERDGTQADLNGFKAVFEIRLGAPGAPVVKTLAVDLQNINDPNRISAPARPGDIGVATPTSTRFSFPFVTIEDVVVFSDRRIGILNDNNFPFSVGRRPGAAGTADDRPDDNEFIIIRLDRPLVGAPGEGNPTPVIPETPLATLLPLAGVVVLGGVALQRRSRRRLHPPAA